MEEGGNRGKHCEQKNSTYHVAPVGRNHVVRVPPVIYFFYFSVVVGVGIMGLNFVASSGVETASFISVVFATSAAKT
jgi:hypothetical protein